ncbi:Legume lectin domain containing protein [Trema orientale]|uniref:Legume lectin domain containing protein n=1 Tax=Trema orientale TaxID=63057 RepID=A0A2P5G0V9_TREOI|nr:Legume lectin domain containing protein [Trema orientale]
MDVADPLFVSADDVSFDLPSFSLRNLILLGQCQFERFQSQLSFFSRVGQPESRLSQRISGTQLILPSLRRTCSWPLSATLDLRFDDPNDSHVGLSINSIETVNTMLLGIYLKGGNIITAWIDHKNDQENVKIFPSYSSFKPEKPILTEDFNLSEYLKANIYMGFWPSTEGSTELHLIESQRLEAEAVAVQGSNQVFLTLDLQWTRVEKPQALYVRLKFLKKDIQVLLLTFYR